MTTEMPAGLSHPQNIRQWFNEQEVTAPPAPELTLTAPEKLTASIEQVAPQAVRLPSMPPINFSTAR